MKPVRTPGAISFVKELMCSAAMRRERMERRLVLAAVAQQPVRRVLQQQEAVLLRQLDDARLRFSAEQVAPEGFWKSGMT